MIPIMQNSRNCTLSCNKRKKFVGQGGEVGDRRSYKGAQESMGWDAGYLGCGDGFKRSNTFQNLPNAHFLHQLHPIKLF